MKYETLSEACRAWVGEFNAIPQSALNKILTYDGSIEEITPPSLNDRVCIYDEDWYGENGEIVGTKYDGDNDLYVVKLDSSGEEVIVSEDCLDVYRDDFWPMWSTMWCFGDNIDEDWLTGNHTTSHLQEMADCGFRIYQSEDFGVLFGIDAAGFDFYEAFWCPLYIARGLHWHKEES